MEAVTKVMAVIEDMAVTEVMEEIMVVDQLFFDQFCLTSSIIPTFIGGEAMIFRLRTLSEATL